MLFAMYIETETTPNPATLKFLPGEPVMPAGTREFVNEDEAAASPLAEALFSLGDICIIMAVGYMDRAFGGYDWRSKYPGLKRYADKLATGAEIERVKSQQAPVVFLDYDWKLNDAR